ncbi:PREDICTED: ubiquitin fusion degradation protein 1 homolog [Amphimedon queenslandica]|uniref:Uncharacterized protein n=1 Tax=Amphimedon queenslandica TaxID=400682 RepID=A0AAN0IDE0_AMPQE|nr:PREDICTED: ubiquitin fusion degradation protein 1 homolog [Amphimedon queenslandica]|eukprot:XP_003385861.1 PREDICTED: ubiquitin fusion degradation protein 1 homolog [Amphimedon queenslandica]
MMSFFSYPPEGMGFPFALGGGRGTFCDNFKCYSMVYFSSAKVDADHGGKIILPPSALERLARLNITYPMLFRLTNDMINRHTHCGVLEFSAEEGRVYVPKWMLGHLMAEAGHLLKIENVTLPLATFSKFQPQSVDFLDISNPKAVLELKLRLFACLTKGDVIQINYNEKNYELLVLETQPNNAVSIIECDMKVDFAAPVGYKEPQPVEPMETVDHDEQSTYDATTTELPTKEFKAFSGQGQRLDGKVKKSNDSNQTQLPQKQQVTQSKRERGIPNYNYVKGRITFARAKSLKMTSEEAMEETEEGFVPFQGNGQALRKKKRSKK